MTGTAFTSGSPPASRVIFGSSIISAVIAVFVLNLVFNYWSWRRPASKASQPR
jgi:hypothetical protein